MLIRVSFCLWMDTFLPKMDNSPDSILYRKALSKASDVHKKSVKCSLSTYFDLFGTLGFL